jgi:branched-chain amino acid transport system substrate-binding protein
MKATKQVTQLLLIGLATFTFTSCRQASNTSDPKNTSAQIDSKNTIEITAILPLTGASSDLGKSVANGMNMAAEEFNAKSLNKKVKLTIDDSKGKPNEAITAYKSWKSKSNSPVVLSWMSSVARSLTTVTQQDKVVLFAGAALPGLTNDSGQVVRVWPKAEALSEITSQYAIKKGFKKIAILYINDDYGKSVSTNFESAVTKAGSKVVAKEPLILGETNFRTIIQKIKQSNPDAIYVPAYGSAYVQGLKQVKEILGKDFPVMADLTILSSFTLAQLGDEKNNVVAPATALDIDVAQSSITQDFAKKYKDKFGQRADFNSGLGYMMFKVAANGINESDGSYQGIAKYVSTTQLFDGPLGTLKFNQQNDVSLPLKMIQIKNGVVQEIN